MSTVEARLAETPFLAAKIGHTDIVAFADESVNLKREDAEYFREQVRRLREKLEKYACDHPDYGLIKTLLSGSLAKGTALTTLNDIDIAFYVKAEKAPNSEPDLLNWLAQRLREAYPQMNPDQIAIRETGCFNCVVFRVSSQARSECVVRHAVATADALH